ncbi:MAG: hypothetical protein FWD43_03455 [Coriobacteriia bacterium]|nr:hypothetical protein [Coriobacteriia bacterium]
MFQDTWIFEVFEKFFGTDNAEMAIWIVIIVLIVALVAVIAAFIIKGYRKEVKRIEALRKAEEARKLAAKKQGNKKKK